MIEKMNAALDFLRDKYGIPAGTIIAGKDYYQLRLENGDTVNLLAHRVERRFVELKKIIDGGTLEDVSTFRFAHFRADGKLEKILANELDLAAFLSGSRVIRVYAVSGGENNCNVIFRLENGMSGCVECGANLPVGAEILDRHEIIARRGVASDRVVDTQVPQSSIYEWTENGKRTFTDVDTELFGLPDEGIWTVRAAYAVLSNPALAAEWNKASADILVQSRAALESARTGKPVNF